ncbi:MAG: amidohydrolase family protein [Algoriphagus sp.]|uniref:amidohydrolase family protein n=1 Tax=Algoriphagus sp. TaxID=1872435 RepID=UPI0017CAD3C8|nr:amidohydrolase family protein [Algoriphagus sp.]NVJ86668.1 amidohydrolase family protein [Algoriphagus sp.]
MKILKKILLGFGLLILLLLLVVAGAFVLDSQNTRFMEVDSNSEYRTNSYLIKNVNLIPMTSDTVMRSQDILILDGKIADIGDEIDPQSVEVIDAKGAFLTPGLIDMHVHVWDDYELGLYLANGVTTVRNLWGHPMHLRMKKAIASEEVLGPLFYTSGPKLTGPEYIGDDNLQLFSPEQAKEKVGEYYDRGYDFIKTYNGLTKELFDAVLDEAKNLDYDVVAHPSAKVDYAYHFRPEIITIEHAEDIVQQPLNYKLDTEKLNKVVDLYASHPATAICPTLTVYHNIYRLISEPNIMSSAELDYMNPLIRMVDSQAQYDWWSNSQASDSTWQKRIKDQHEFHLLAIQKIQERGGLIVAGTDAGIGVTPAGSSMHEELAFYQQAGMSAFEALETATINPSKTHDFLNDQGSIATGKIANLILTKENPLEDLLALKDPLKVFVRGRKIERATLLEFKERAKNRPNKLVSGLRYAENLLIEK